MTSDRAAVGVLCLVCALAPRTASAQQPGPNAALAEELFEKGKALMTERRYDEACPMLAESQRIDPGGGTLLTVALCHERQGKTATAWVELKDALARATKDGEADREALAKEHLAALEPKLVRLTVRVAPLVAALPGLSVRLDGLTLERPAWGFGAPVDPGAHRVEASAPGKRPFSVDVTVSSTSGAVVDVPPLLELAPVAPAELPRAMELRPKGPRARTVVGVGMIGAGAVSFAVGAGAGVLAIVKQSDSNARCPMQACPDLVGRQENATARTAAVVADVAVPLGLLMAGAGALLLVTAPRPRATGARAAALGIALAPGGGALASMAGSF